MLGTRASPVSFEETSATTTGTTHVAHDLGQATDTAIACGSGLNDVSSSNLIATGTATN